MMNYAHGFCSLHSRVLKSHWSGDASWILKLIKSAGEASSHSPQPTGIIFFTSGDTRLGGLFPEFGVQVFSFRSLHTFSVVDHLHHHSSLFVLSLRVRVRVTSLFVVLLLLVVARLVGSVVGWRGLLLLLGLQLAILRCRRKRQHWRVIVDHLRQSDGLKCVLLFFFIDDLVDHCEHLCLDMVAGDLQAMTTALAVEVVDHH